MSKITTRKQEKQIKLLKQKKYRQLYKEFLVEGVRLCEDLVNSSYQIKEIFYSSELKKSVRGEKLLKKIRKKEIDNKEVSTSLLEQMCTTKNLAPIIARVEQKLHDLNEELLANKKRILVLENVSDPGNTGTIIRTAEAFSWDAVVLTHQSIELYNPKLVRATMGSIFRFPIFCTKLSTLMSFFEYNHIDCITTSKNDGQVAHKFCAPKKMALFLGSEAHGVSSCVEEKAHHKISIPTQHVESLNLAIAGGILLFLYRPQ